jgi:hypothetical protein
MIIHQLISPTFAWHRPLWIEVSWAESLVKNKLKSAKTSGFEVADKIHSAFLFVMYTAINDTFVILRAIKANWGSQEAAPG